VSIRHTAPPSQPVIAERRLRRTDSGGTAELRVFRPETGERGQPDAWLCGYDITGVPELEQLSYLRREPGTVFFAPGNDSLDALVTAWSDIRGILDLLNREFAIGFTAPGVSSFDHGVPATVFSGNGPVWERRLREAMDREMDVLTAEGLPTAAQDYYHRHGHTKPRDTTE